MNITRIRFTDTLNNAYPYAPVKYCPSSCRVVIYEAVSKSFRTES